MASNYRFTYGVDLVFCIDATGSMGPLLDTVKANALNLYRDLMKIMDRKNKRVEQVRIRIIAFRNYKYDQETAMMVTDFFRLPDEEKAFEASLRSIVPEGGGDDPEDGLEALAYAIRSPWDTSSQRKRHVIVVWSDDGTHKLGFGSDAPNYPRGMAKDFNELTMWWGNASAPGLMDQNAKRLLLFTPDKDDWNLIRNNWNQTIQYVSEAGSGLESCDYEQIINAIANSI